MKALIYEGPQKISLQEIDIPEISDDEALIEVEACGVCGTDLVKIFNGSLKPPVPLGHEVSGRIHKVGKRVKGFKKGDRVMVAHHVPCFECHYCRRDSHSMCRDFKKTNLDPGGFAQFVRVSGKHLEHTVLKLPAKLSFEAASQVEPLACCLRNLRRLRLQEGDLAVIIGLETIGLMTAQLLQQQKVSVLGFDTDSLRVRTAQKAGIEHAYTGKDGRSEELVGSLSEYRGADALIFTTGTPALVTERLSWVRDGGTINVFASFHPEPRATIDLNAVYHRELTFLSSYSAAPEDLRTALKLLSSQSIRIEPHTDHTYSMDRFNEAIRQVRGREVLKAILLPQKTLS